MIVTKAELKGINASIFQSVEDIFAYPKAFPCLFAINSYHKNMMFFSDYSEKNCALDVIADISLDLINFNKFIKLNVDSCSFPFYTLVFILPSPKDSTNISLMNYVLDIIDYLRRSDNLEWPVDKEKDIFNKDFELYFNQARWFPVLLTPQHPNEIRRADFTLLAFQSGDVFDSLRRNNNVKYEKIRQAVHRKIDMFYNYNRPYYLTPRSSGKNIVQYLGFDPDEESKCPIKSHV